MKKGFIFLLFFYQTLLLAQNCQHIGMNLHFISFWSREVPFANLMMQAAPWVPCDSDWQFDQTDNYLSFNKIVKNEQGYPTHLPQIIQGLAKPQIVKTILAWDNGGILPSGNYEIKYDGKGIIELFGLDTINIISEKPGNIIFNLKPNKLITNVLGHKGGGLGLLIRQSELGNPISNIRVLLPNMDPNVYPFNPAFIEKLKPFKAIRFMNWNASYWSDETKWAERRQMNYYTQFNGIDWYSIDRKGVAIEYAIQLCNILEKDMWISIPYQADENYIGELGKLVLNTLNPKLKVYIEYGNEVWNEGIENIPNDAFERQYNFVKTNAPEVLKTEPFQYSYAYFADRAFKAFNPFSSNRVIRVLAGQQGAWQGEVLKRSIEGMAFIGSKDSFDVGSIADYMFQQDAINSLPNYATVSDVAAAFRNVMDVSLLRINENIQQLELIGKKMITYEGGVHANFNEGDPNENALLAFSNDTSFYNISREWLEKVSSLPSVEMQMAFVLADDKYGYWHLQNIFEENPNSSLKYKAIIDHCNTVDIDFIEPEPDISIFPNPVKDEMIFGFESPENYWIQIFDFQGNMYKEAILNSISPQISIADLPKGIFLISLKNAKNKIVKKFIKIE